MGLIHDQTKAGTKFSKSSGTEVEIVRQETLKPMARADIPREHHSIGKHLKEQDKWSSLALEWELGRRI